MALETFNGKIERYIESIVQPKLSFIYSIQQEWKYFFYMHITKFYIRVIYLLPLEML
jgi:hypothetical protein